MSDTYHHIKDNAPVDDWRGQLIPLREAAVITKEKAGIGCRHLYSLVNKAVRFHRGEVAGLEDQELLQCLYQRRGSHFLDREGITQWAEKRDKPRPFLTEPGSEGFYE